MASSICRSVAPAGMARTSRGSSTCSSATGRFAGLTRWTSGFPFNVANCRSCWTTNWNVQGNASLVNPGQLPDTKTTDNVVDHRPSPFPDPAAAAKFYRFSLPGEQGVRNALRGDGYFTIDLSLSKGFELPFGAPPALPLGRVQRDEYADVRREWRGDDA